MKLKALTLGLDILIKGKKEVEIHGLCAHSKKVAPGDLFIALKGSKTDGSLYVEEAQRAGAVALLTDLYNPFLGEFTQLICKDVHQIQLELIKRFYKNPSSLLSVIGVTGTNGKTTTTYLIKHVLEKLKKTCGLIGTIETIIGKFRCPSQLTTPDVLSLHQMLSEMVRQKCNAAVMEVSSHALVQKRLEEIEIDVAIFTNLSQDHLDYHQTMQEYAKAKQLLFSHLDRFSQKKIKRGVINLDDLYAPMMIQACHHPYITYGIEQKKAELRAFDLDLSHQKSLFNVSYQGETVLFETPLVGRFNVYNTLAAIGALLALGVSLHHMKEPFKSFSQVPGRLQKVTSCSDLSVYIDFAHTDKALENVLHTLKQLTEKKLILVFGCGGDRDKTKRPLMGNVAAKLADVVILTSDNPRSEDPYQIIEQIMAGIENKEKCHVEVDRKKAIEKAISLACSSDCVVIAGKGHEMTQTFKDRFIAFSDYLVAEQSLLQKELAQLNA